MRKLTKKYVDYNSVIIIFSYIKFPLTDTLLIAHTIVNSERVLYIHALFFSIKDKGLGVIYKCLLLRESTVVRWVKREHKKGTQINN